MAHAGRKAVYVGRREAGLRSANEVVLLTYSDGLFHGVFELGAKTTPAKILYTLKMDEPESAEEDRFGPLPLFPAYYSIS